jgi:hypothetical protein
MIERFCTIKCEAHLEGEPHIDIILKEASF